MALSGFEFRNLTNVDFFRREASARSGTVEPRIRSFEFGLRRAESQPAEIHCSGSRRGDGERRDEAEQDKGKSIGARMFLPLRGCLHETMTKV